MVRFPTTCTLHRVFPQSVVEWHPGAWLPESATIRWWKVCSKPELCTCALFDWSAARRTCCEIRQSIRRSTSKTNLAVSYTFFSPCKAPSTVYCQLHIVWWSIFLSRGCCFKTTLLLIDDKLAASCHCWNMIITCYNTDPVWSNTSPSVRTY